MDYAVVRKVVRDVFRKDRVTYPDADLLTVAHDTDRSYLYDGRYYSPLIDTLEDDVRAAGGRCTSVARIISSIKGDKAYGDVRSPEGAFARAFLQKRLLGVLRRGSYPYSRPEENIWSEILSATGAKSVVAIQPSRELCVASHKKGVWVADIQHGVIAEQHPWYGQQFRSKDPVEQLPDAFLCWDHGSANVIRRWADERIETPIVGNLWLNRFMRRAAHDTLVRAVESQVGELPCDGRKAVLVTLSWGAEDLSQGFIAKPLEAAILNTSGRIRWLIRLHPNQLTGFATDEGPRFLRYFDNTLKGHAHWEWATRVPLPYLLSRVDTHVSWHSSVSIEAALCGLRTGLLDPRLWPGQEMEDYFSHLKSTGDIDLLTLREQDIVAWVDRTTKLGRRPKRLDDTETIYKQIVRRIVQSRQGSNRISQMA